VTMPVELSFPRLPMLKNKETVRKRYKLPYS